jgi:hypothetical protein
VRLVQGVVFGGAFGAVVGPRERSQWQTLVAALLLVTGLLMWAAGLRQWGKAVDPAGGPSLSSR